MVIRWFIMINRGWSWVSIHGVPQNGWFINVSNGKSEEKMMRTGGSPILGKPQIEIKPGKCWVYCTCYVMLCFLAYQSINYSLSIINIHKR